MFDVTLRYCMVSLGYHPFFFLRKDTVRFLPTFFFLLKGKGLARKCTPLDLMRPVILYPSSTVWSACAYGT